MSPAAEHGDDITIGRMTEDDLMQVHQIEVVSFGSPWSISSFYTEIHNPIGRYYAAHKHGQVIGYIGVLVIRDEGQMTTLAVHPGLRHEGIGRMLLGFLLRQLSMWGLKDLTLEVRASNIAAQNLYRSFGFCETGVRPGYYDLKEDAVMMLLPDLQDSELRRVLGLIPTVAQDDSGPSEGGRE